MTPDQQIKLAEIISSTLQSLFWPGIVLFLILYFGTPLKKFIGSLGELTFKAGGVEASAKKEQLAQAAASLFPDVERKIRANFESEMIVKELKETASRQSTSHTEQDVARLLSSIADKTVETIRRENFITVDPRPLVGISGEVWQFPHSQYATVSDFLDNVWFLLRPYGIPSMRYGIEWLLRDAQTGKLFPNMGRKWAGKFGRSLDTRSLTDVGFIPGIRLEATPIEQDVESRTAA